MNGNSKAQRNWIFNADCIDVMDSFDTGSVDFILTDPPYITRYKSRQGHTVINDDNSRWLQPAFNQMHRVLKDGGLCVSFYGWNKIDLFFEAWKAAGFRSEEHTSELQSLMRISYAVFCLKKNINQQNYLTLTASPTLITIIAHYQ